MTRTPKTTASSWTTHEASGPPGEPPGPAGAADRAREKALGALEAGDPKAAQEYLKLARMLEEGQAAVYRPSPQDEAALAFVLERLKARGE